jgi:outer membrane protein assembly factor BamA
VTQYRLLGNANLAHAMGRTWIAAAGFSRTLGFIAAFHEPVLADSATASLGGQLTRRIAWTSLALWTRGYIGLDAGRHYDSSGASSNLSFGITRQLGAFLQYSYYRNQLPDGSTTFAGLTNFSRQTAIVGLTLYVPIFNSPRKTR